MEIKELHSVRALLVEKFGKDVALASMEGEGVAERVLKKLKIDMPKPELVDAYLAEIARFYGVPYGELKSADDEDGDDDDEPSGGIAERALEEPLEADKDSKKEDEQEELVKAKAPNKLGPQSPVRVVPPSPSSDNIAPRLKLPGAAAAKIAKSDAAARKTVKKEDGLGKIPDVDELAKRFAQLKR